MSDELKTDEIATPNGKPDTWRKRRAMLWSITVLCFMTIIYSLLKDPKYGEIAIESAFWVLTINSLGYVFGAVLDDSTILTKRR